MPETTNALTDTTGQFAASGVPAILQEAWDLVVLGGPVVAILAMMSVVSLAIIVVKVWQFRAGRVLRLGNVRKAISFKRQGKEREALACIQGDANPVARTMSLALRAYIHGGVGDDEIREEVHRFGTRRIESLRSYLRPLEVIASLAPLLGLFGTVLGMISAFQQMEAAGSRVDPSVLSGGIWEALLTTAVGLAVAIPSVAALNWLERIVERTEAEMSNALTVVFTRDLSRLSSPSHEPVRRVSEMVGAD